MIGKNRLHDASIGMFKGTRDFAVVNAAALAAANIAPIFTTYVGKLTTIIGQIEDTEQKTAVSSKPSTTNKSAARETAAEMAIIIRDIIINYAADKNRPNLDEPASADNPVNYPMQDLENRMRIYTDATLKEGGLPDQAVLAALNNIWVEAGVISDVTPPATNPLIPYGLKLDVGEVGDEDYEPGTITKYETAIDTYSTLSTSPRQVIITRKTENEKVRGLYAKGNETLVKMDKCINLIRNTNRDLFNGYMSNRILIVQSFATQIVGNVLKVTDLDTQTTEVALGATILVTAESYTKQKNGQTVTVQPIPVELRIGSDGKYAVPTPDIKPLYTVKCTMPGYQAVVKSPIQVKLGDKSTINFVLIPEEQSQSSQGS